MRQIIVEGDGFKIAVRGRNRRGPALESEYLLGLKNYHATLQPIKPDDQVKDAETLASRDPRGWSLMGVANGFRVIAARLAWVETPDGSTHEEPFAPSQLAELFDHYLDVEQLPDKSDLWSRVEAAIIGLDTPEQPTDPEARSGA